MVSIEAETKKTCMIRSQVAYIGSRYCILLLFQTTVLLTNKIAAYFRCMQFILNLFEKINLIFNEYIEMAAKTW